MNECEWNKSVIQIEFYDRLQSEVNIELFPAIEWITQVRESIMVIQIDRLILQLALPI